MGASTSPWLTGVRGLPRRLLRLLERQVPLPPTDELLLDRAMRRVRRRIRQARQRWEAEHGIVIDDTFAGP